MKKHNPEALRRALKERDEARAFQAATDEILTAISRSTSDAKPVFDAIVRNVPRLFDTRYVAVFLIKGEELYLAAAKAHAAFQRRHAARFRRFQESFPQPIDWKGFTGTALRSGRMSQIGPIIGNPKATPEAVRIAKEFGYNTMLVAPLMLDGKAIGAIGTTRPGVKLFSTKELGLFRAFAAQAVIAIENARLFNETKEALEQQTATTEILKVISASPTSTQPVFESIVNNCGVLFKDSRVALWQISEGRLLPRASTGYMPGPMPLDRESAVGACVLESRTIHLPDLRLAAEQHPRIKQLGLKHGYLSGVFAPLMREGQAVGAVSVLRRELGAFSDKEVALLGTFADQAVIAIENARLFNETKEALEQQTTTASVLRVIAGSPTELKPVMSAVVEKAARLLEADHALIGQSDGENIHWLAAYGCPIPDGARSITRELPSGRAILDLQTTQIEDIGKIERDSLLERSYGRFGVRTICATPLIREGRAVGVILLRRTQVRPFTEKQMSLLRTFADQAVIAIENARLFNETKEALEQQTASSEILRVISRTPGDIQPVLEAIVQNALRLCGASFGGVWFFDGALFRRMHVIFAPTSQPEFVDRLTTGPIHPGPETPLRRVAIDKAPVHTADILNDPAFSPPPYYRREGMRAALAVPMLKDGALVGALAFHRYEPKPFTEKQIALVQAFASQAVIAIENSRLFDELKSSNASLRDTLEQQTSTAEILRVISGTPTDTQPVFDAIVQSAQRLMSGKSAALILRRESEFFVAAFSAPGLQQAPADVRTVPLDREKNFPSRVILDGEVVHIPNWEADEVPEHERAVARALGFASGLQVPLLRDGQGIGALVVTRQAKGRFQEKEIALLRSFADQAVIAIENVRLFNETKEALERQTAISDILRVISASPADVKPVLDTVASHAARICHAQTVDIALAEGLSLRIVASVGDEGRVLGQVLPLDRGSVSGRSILDRVSVHVADLQEAGSEFPVGSELAHKYGFRTILGVPLLREGRALGAIMVRRTEVRPLEDKHVALLKTFADQAAIAIENVRLFNETKEALERQTATAEILKVMSASPSDVQPVFDAVAENAARVCGVDDVAILRTEGADLRRVAHYGSVPVSPDSLVPVPPGSVNERVLSEHRTLHAPDTAAPSFAREFPGSQFPGMGVRSLLATPLVHDGAAIGVIHLRRSEPRPFTDKQIALLETFAAQAVIAIENVRLFNETREALERQTATADILRVISGSPADVQPVFEAILASATRLCGARTAVLHLYEGDEQFRPVAVHGARPEYREWMLRSVYRIGRPFFRVEGPWKPAQIEDVQQLPEPFASEPPWRANVELEGIRTLLNVPLVKEERYIGCLTVYRREMGRFADKEIALLQTFADQAVIAIENTRLFNETKEALEQQTASAAVLRVIGSSPAELPPVFDSILENAMRLCDASLATVGLYDGKLYRHVAQRGGSPEYVKFLFGAPFEPNPQYTLGRMIAERQPFHAPDYRELPAYKEGNPRSVATVELGGTRTYLAVPMLKEGQVVGGITVRRTEVRPFTQKQIDLVRTFADQAVIAIENTRLFNETREALEQQTAMAEVLQVISASMADTAPVFDKILQSCKRLFSSAEHGILLVAEDGRVRIAAHHGSAGERVTELVAAGLADGLVQVEAIRQRKALHFVDALADEARGPVQRVAQRLGIGSYSQVVAPMLWEDQPVGWLYAIRQPATGFKEAEIALLKAFADQAVIAIQNSRLFNETKEALERQTATGEILASMSGSMTDAKPVFDAIVRNLLRLFGSGYAVVSLRRGQFFELGGFEGESGFERLRELYPIPVDEHSIVGEVIMARQVRRYAPVVDNPAVPRRTAEIGQRFGFNSIIATPMMWKGEAVGTIVAARRQPLPFDDKQVALIQSFADQAVIAIENVRLFKELQERTEALTKSVSQLTALGEVGQAISSTLELDQVLKTIVQRAVQLAGLDGGSIYEFEARDERFHLRAAVSIAEEILDVSRKSPIRLGEGAVGRAGATRKPVVVEDVLDESYRSRARELIIKSGARALLAVPLLREDLLLGALVVSRKSPGPFAPEAIELLKTFATQSAVAIQNARLFREIEEKSRQLEEASRHKSQFLASMSHELRTPLNAILGFNEMILGQVYGEVPSDMKEPLEDIQKSGKHLLRLINNVLDLAKIEAGKMELSLADYSVHDTVESVRSTLRPLAEAKGLELVVSVPEDIPLAYGDGGRLTQCLMNLAGNSLKFTKEGKVEIAVQAENGCLRWRVSDTGIGIPADKIPTLFSEFKQTDATIASEYGGTGLGLSITKKFVEMHGGRIWVESELGKGSVFTLEIPLRVTVPA